MSSIYGKGPKGKATRLHAQIVRARGKCERCGVTDDTLQCAHIISRRYSHTRTDLDNAFCLCASCHFFFGGNPLVFADFVRETKGEDGYQALVVRAQGRSKVDWVAEAARLDGIWKGLDV